MTGATAAKSRNGAGALDHAEFPVDSFREAAPHLRRPFTPAAVKFKVQATWQGGALIVGYIDARLAVERLNLVVPHLWFDEYQPIDGGRLLCRLTIDGITRHDIGDGYQGKGLYSDAFKRAAVKFGVGVSLYAIPQTFLDEKQGHLKPKKVNGKDSYVLTPNGEQSCRTRYGQWLDTVGVGAFGEPLDHGDVEDAQGDAEAPEPTVAHEETQPLSIEQAQRLADAAEQVGVLDKLQLAAAHASGGEVADCSTVEDATLALVVLTEAQAAKVEAWISKKAKEAAGA